MNRLTRVRIMLYACLAICICGWIAAIAVAIYSRHTNQDRIMAIGSDIEIQLPKWVWFNYKDEGVEPSESEPLFYPPATRQGEAVRIVIFNKGQQRKQLIAVFRRVSGQGNVLGGVITLDSGEKFIFEPPPVKNWVLAVSVPKEKD
ncbi:MAG: hypothetical protein A3F47_01770 [Candidatus Staskawiczbacteria bacterium RIFCSPHIGHO2_12_FULL_38_11]|uniref:Uncharacterized protein n=1 Tax=Candidatus Staskawiczbacteria bacterium RIFCSPHIGHO2_12_FULL_38_11 TaxID=1802209 RepID=A0A1G2I4M7_9BACT|nr:MAG: hypothetical protein A3F47_01770 [Candidatus Staskawiczbacteria bacterium RIFCSPHIGHO2_12_FULL_38_11]